MAQLNVNEAQRKAMLEWMGEVDPDDFDYEEWLDGLFAAANSIPEGPPVGTIARRPDGAFVAVRALASDLGEYWTYTCVDHTAYEDDLVPWPGQYDADSWPVIYDPREPDGPDLLAHKFSDAGIPIPSWANSVEVKVEAPNSTAQQELEAFNRFPGIENVTAADRIGADNADAQLGLVFKLRDIRIGRGLEISDVAAAMEVSAAEVARFESGSTNPRMSMIRRYARAVEAVFTVDVRKWEEVLGDPS